MANAPLHTLTDSFTGTSLYPRLWTSFTAGGATVSFTSAGASVNYPASSTSSTFADVASAGVYDLTGSYGHLHVTSVPSASTSADAEFRIAQGNPNGTSYFRFVKEGTTLGCQYTVTGSTTTVNVFTYNAVTHAWWRIREHAGTTFWETSPDGLTWTVQGSAANPFNVTGVAVRIDGLCFENETNPGTYTWSAFNLVPAAAFSGAASMGITQPAAAVAGKLLHATPWTHDKAAGAGFDVTIPATAPGSILICTSSAAAVTACHLGSQSGTTFTKRSPTSAGTYEVACQDITDTTGGTTRVGVTLGAAENAEGVIYEFTAGSLTFGSGISATAAALTADWTVQAGQGGTLTVTPPGRAVIFSAYADNYSTAVTGDQKYWGVEPAGRQFLNVRNTGTGSQHWALHAISDVTAGIYTPTTSRTASGTVAQAGAWYYADATTLPSYPAWPNQIAQENSRPGVQNGQWFISGANQATGGIWGYSDATSYLPGTTASFKVDSAANAYTFEIYRLGAYGHQQYGARRVQAATAGAAVVQPAPTTDAFGGTVCAWTVNATWAIPASAVPGVYQAVFRRADNTALVYGCLFTVRSVKPVVRAAGTVMFRVTDWTWQAYNVWGAATDSSAGFTGRSLYAKNSQNGALTTRAFAVSFDRPYATGNENPITYFFDAEYSLLTFLEASGYSIGYYSTTDVEADQSIPAAYTVAVVGGHDEYWTTGLRDAYEGARDAGTNLAFFSSNISLWHVRFDTTTDPARRKIVCYKDSWDLAGWDSVTTFDPVSYTGTWRDTRTTGGGVNNTSRRPECALTGQVYENSAVAGNGDATDTQMNVTAAFATIPFWRHTAAANLTTGQSQQYGPLTGQSLLGAEIDSVTTDPATPPQLVKLHDQTTGTSSAIADVNGVNYTGTGTLDVSMSLYRTRGGALVFAAGTWRYAYGCSVYRGAVFDSASTAVQDVQQSVLNLLCDLGVTPPALPDSLAYFSATAYVSPASYTIAAFTTPAPAQPYTAYGFTAPLSPLASLADPFNGTSVNPALWTSSTAGGMSLALSNSGAALIFPASATSVTFGDISSVSLYDLTGSYGSLHVLATPSPSTSADTEMRITQNGNPNGNYLRWIKEGTGLGAQYNVGGVRTTLTNFTYNAVTHAWWRIREHDSVIFWETSPDSAAWTVQGSVVTPFPVTSVGVQIDGLCFENETLPGTFQFRDFNTGLAARSSATVTAPRGSVAAVV